MWGFIGARSGVGWGGVECIGRREEENGEGEGGLELWLVIVVGVGVGVGRMGEREREREKCCEVMRWKMCGDHGTRWHED